MKTVGIEEFAAWCVQNEWPKANSADMEAETLARSAILGAMGLPLKPKGPASTGEGFSLMVGEGALPAVRVAGIPHPDAVLFSHACNALAAEASSPDYDVDGLLSDQAGVLRALPGERLAIDWRLTSQQLRGARPDPKRLVVTYAAMARAPTGREQRWTIRHPDWHPDEIERSHVRGDGGRGQPAWFVTVRRRVRVSGKGEAAAYEVREFEEEGLCPRLRRPKAGAYRKVSFSPDPGMVARERHSYAVWWCALEYLAAWLEASGALSAHRVIRPQGIEKPWQSDRKRVA